MRMLDDEIARAHRSKTPCSIALIDLDWFKRINDAYGHPTGDEVLRTFAITMFANIRSIDRFGRYGGEEFLLILPDTPHDAPRAFSTGCARSSPISTGARSRPACA
jgi:diguanylate cyclase (GGDEF)-like protein